MPKEEPRVQLTVSEKYIPEAELYDRASRIKVGLCSLCEATRTTGL